MPEKLTRRRERNFERDTLFSVFLCFLPSRNCQGTCSENLSLVWFAFELPLPAAPRQGGQRLTPDTIPWPGATPAPDCPCVAFRLAAGARRRFAGCGIWQAPQGVEGQDQQAAHHARTQGLRSAHEEQGQGQTAHDGVHGSRWPAPGC